MTGKLLKDLILIVVILAIGFSILYLRRIPDNIGTVGEDGHRNVYAEITSSYGKHIVYLDYDTIFSLPSIPYVIFEVSDGQIAFIKSDCPDQICVRTGFLNHPGLMAACLPNNLILVMINRAANDDDIDIFLR